MKLRNIGLSFLIFLVLTPPTLHAGCFGDFFNRLGGKGGFKPPATPVEESTALLGSAGERHVEVTLADGSKVRGKVQKIPNSDEVLIFEDVEAGGAQGRIQGRRVKVAEIAPGGVSYTDAVLPNGERVSLSGNEQYVSWPNAGAGTRTPGRVKRIFTDAKGVVHVEVEEITQSSVKASRELTAEELKGTKFSNTSKEGYAARQAPPAAPAPVTPAKPIDVADGVPPSGNKISTQGDAKYISFQEAGAPQRIPGRVRRMWMDGSGNLHVEAEVWNPAKSKLELRELTSGELKNVKVSGSAKVSLEHKPGVDVAGGGTPGAAKPVVESASAPKLTKPGDPAARKAVFGEQKALSAYDGGAFNGGSPDPRGGAGKVRLNYLNGDREYARSAGRLFEDTAPSALPRGKKYTYIVTEDGKMTFGEVVDGTEFGVKHAHLANGRKVLAAGELAIDEAGHYAFNLESGSYSMKIMEKGLATEGQLEGRVSSIFEGELGAGGEYTKSKLTSTAPPTPAEYKQLCGSAQFLKLNGMLCK